MSASSTPASGLVISSTPTISADGTILTVDIRVNSDAALGDRVIQVTTPGGVTGSNAAPANTFTVYPP